MKPGRRAIIAMAAASQLLCGCFSTVYHSRNNSPTAGGTVGFFLLDVVTSPAQLIWAIGSGLDDLHERSELRARERRIAKAAENCRARLPSMAFDPESYDVWDYVTAKAIERLVSDRSVAFTEEQLKGIDAIWARQDRRLGEGKGGWRPNMPDLWARPEWTPESLAAACAGFLDGMSYYRRTQLGGYVGSPSVPDDCLEAILAHYAGSQLAVVTMPEVFAAARSNLMSRFVRDGAWREGLARDLRFAEWPGPASTNLLAEADIAGILREASRFSFDNEAEVKVFGSPAEARRALLEILGGYGPRGSILRRGQGEAPIGEVCFADMEGEHPSFVAFAMANATVAVRAGDGHWPPDALRLARRIAMEMKRRLGVPE